MRCHRFSILFQHFLNPLDEIRRAVACALRLVRPRGAGNDGRNRSFFRMGLLTVGVMGIAFCALGEFFLAALPPLAGIVGV